MRAIVIVAAMLVAGGSAHAADTQGSATLALGALVGLHAPGLSARKQETLCALLDGRSTVPATGPITVKADAVTCRSSNVDIASHDCTLTFGATKRTLKGRRAHELFATLLENGVPGDGAAGSNFESVTHLACTIDPAVVEQRGGGGATCSVTPGP